MLRLLVLLLLLTNGLYYAWANEWLRTAGVEPDRQDEPQRIAQQIEPQRLRLLKAEEVSRLQQAQAPAEPTECLQAGLFEERHLETLRPALEKALPANSWTLEPGTLPGRWILYMGRYADAEAVEKKRAQLRARNVRFEPLANPTLEPGLSLGSYASEAAANDGLAALAERGVRTARVLQVRNEQRGHWLRLPAADAAQRARLEELHGTLAGRTVRPCR